MLTDDLIAVLSERVPPVKPGAVIRILLIGTAIGLATTTLLMLLTLGLRPDLTQALRSAPFWLKSSYTLAIACVAGWMVERSGRPGCKPSGAAPLLAIPVLTIVALAIWQLVQPGADWRLLLLGHTARVCAVLIAYLSIPLLAAIFWALRSLAPTRLVQAGAAAGLLSGSAAATIYAIHCPETAAPFVAIWYSAGVFLSTAAGALLGRWALRW
jgi:hypothetical protein